MIAFYARGREGGGYPVGAMNLPFEGNAYFGALLGFVATMLVASVLNQFGNTMFRKRVAMPFFFGRRRVHHRQVLFYFLPAAYTTLVALFFAGYVKIVWSLFSTGLLCTVVIAASCLVFDLCLDYSRGGGRLGFLHHEWIYLTVPAFAFSSFLRLAL
jgi:hypothetical protein